MYMNINTGKVSNAFLQTKILNSPERQGPAQLVTPALYGMKYKDKVTFGGH